MLVRDSLIQLKLLPYQESSFRRVKWLSRLGLGLGLHWATFPFPTENHVRSSFNSKPLL